MLLSSHESRDTRKGQNYIILPLEINLHVQNVSWKLAGAKLSP